MRSLVETKREEVALFPVGSKRTSIYLHALSPPLTFAGFNALRPAVVKASAVDTSTVLVPSTTRSATTDSSGFLEHAAL